MAFGIWVFACSPSSVIARLGERREQRLVAETARQRQIRRIAGQRRHVGEHLVHAAVLGAQHALELLVRHRRGRRRRPGRELPSARRAPGRCRREMRASRRPAKILCIVYHGHADERAARDGILELRRAIGKRADESASRGRV